MRKKFMAMMITACMVLSGINAPSYAMTKESTIKILENKGDTYTLENYVTSLEEAEQIQKYYLEENIVKYSITLDADVDWKNSVKGGSFIDTIDGPESKHYNEAMHFIYAFDCTEKSLNGNYGKKYTVLTFDLSRFKDSDLKEYAEKRVKMQEVKKKFLATMPNLDEMSDYEKVLGILSFMSYINYDYDSLNAGKTVDDAYTALVEGRATCVGFANAFSFLATIAGVENKIAWGEYRNDNHGTWSRYVESGMKQSRRTWSLILRMMQSKTLILQTEDHFFQEQQTWMNGLLKFQTDTYIHAFILMKAMS